MSRVFWRSLRVSSVVRVFVTWADAATAMMVVAAVNLAVYLREARSALGGGTVAARFEFPRCNLPDHAKNLSSDIVGQQREDGQRRRRALMLVLAVAAAAQAIGFDGYVAAGLTLGLWSLLLIANRAYDKLLYGLLGLMDAGEMSILEELREILRGLLKPNYSNPLRGKWLPLGIPAGGASIGLALVGWLALISAFGVDWKDVSNPLGELIGTGRPAWVGVAGGIAIVLARVPLDLARRYALAHPTLASRHKIVFLRSFQDDRLSIRVRGPTRGITDRLTMRHRHRYEQLLVASMQHFGPVVAIGQPGERLPPTGAFRLYYENDEWQDAVAQMLYAARYVVLSVGATPSVGWEISKLKEMDILGRTVFLVPPVGRAARRERLELLARRLDIDPKLLLPPGLGVEYVGVMFKDGRAVPLASRDYDYAAYHAAVLEVGFDQFERAE